MNTELALMDEDSLNVIQRTAKLLAVSGYFDAKGESLVAIAQVATKILAGRELGFGPFAAMNGIHIIQGRPSVGANLMASAVKGSGRYDYRVREMSDKTCRIEFFERTNGKLESLGTSEFNAEDARKAGTKNMDKYPRNMLFARAMSNGVRFYTPDVFSGNAVYVPEELGADVDADGNVIEGEIRVVDTTTGEITNPSTRAAQTPRSAPTVQPDKASMAWPNGQQPDDVDFGMSDVPTGHNPFDDAPDPARAGVPDPVAVAIDELTGQPLRVIYAWGVSCGGCANEHEARNSWQKFVDANGGLSPKTGPTILRDYVQRQLTKAAQHSNSVAVA